MRNKRLKVFPAKGFGCHLWSNPFCIGMSEHTGDFAVQDDESDMEDGDGSDGDDEDEDDAESGDDEGAQLIPVRSDHHSLPCSGCCIPTQ